MQKNSLNGIFRNIIPLLLICIGTVTCFAQKKGYDIRVLIPEKEGKMFYLQGFYGDESSYIDSCRVKKGIARFKSGALLPDGYYQIRQGTGSADFAIVVEQSRNFTISSETVSNSIENQTYQNFSKHLAGSTWEDHVLTEALCSTSPNSLVSQYMKLEKYGLDSCDQMENRLLRHPEFNYLISKQLMSADITVIDQTIEKFGATSEIGKYYLAKMLKHYNMDNNAPYDDILVHLYDKYYLPNKLQLYSDTYERTLKRAIIRKRHTLVGAKIPYLEAVNADGKRESTQNPQRAYTVIWFWDPDCEDCQEETPILHQMYVEHGEEYDFEVFAHSLTADTDRWKRISKEWGLTWPNTCSEMGESNYDFIDYFNIVTTPCCLLIDQNHKIIMRQFTLEQLENFFEENKKEQ